MNNQNVQRVWHIAALGLSGLVLLISLAGIIGVWYANYVASSLVTDLSVAIEKSAQGLERSVLRVDTQVDNLRGEVSSIQQAVTQVSQNVADQGLVRQLLPDAQVERMDNAFGRVRDTADAIRDSYAALLDMYRAVNRIPFVSLPSPSEESVTRVTENVGQLRQDVSDLRTAVANVRARQANAIERVNGLTARVDTRLGSIQDSLHQVSTALTNAQTAAKQLRATITGTLALVSVLLTLFLLWVIVSQVLVIRPMWARVQAARSAPAVWETVAIETQGGGSAQGTDESGPPVQ